MAWCTPGMGVNLWGVSPLYVNPVNGLITLTKVRAEGKGGTVREEAFKIRYHKGHPKNGIVLTESPYITHPGK